MAYTAWHMTAACCGRRLLSHVPVNISEKPRPFIQTATGAAQRGVQRRPWAAADRAAGRREPHHARRPGAFRGRALHRQQHGAGGWAPCLSCPELVLQPWTGLDAVAAAPLIAAWRLRLPARLHASRQRAQPHRPHHTAGPHEAPVVHNLAQAPASSTGSWRRCVSVPGFSTPCAGPHLISDACRRGHRAWGAGVAGAATAGGRARWHKGAGPRVKVRRRRLPHRAGLC